MKIKKEYIGAKCWSKLTSRFYKIEESQGELYMNLGIFYIYENDQPKLIKHVNTTKRQPNKLNNDDNGINNNSESALSV